MKPPTPAMIRLLREIGRLGEVKWNYDKRTLKALHSRGLIGRAVVFLGSHFDTEPRYSITYAGRRVLAEHTTTGETT